MDKQSLEALSSFFSQFKKLSYKKHEMILRADDTPSGVYFLESGYVREYAVSPDGEELTLLLFKPTDVFPVRWAITNISNEKYFDTLTPAVVWRAPRKAFLDFLKTHPSVLFSFTKYLLLRFGLLVERTEHLVYDHASEKVASMLYILLQRLGVQDGQTWSVPVAFTHKDIASLVGMTRETVSLEIEKLAKKQVIEYHNHMLVVKDITVLQKAAQLR